MWLAREARGEVGVGGSGWQSGIVGINGGLWIGWVQDVVECMGGWVMEVDHDTGR